MIDAKLIIFIIVWIIAIIGYGGGILYGLRFLRSHEMIDMRVPEFTKDMLFGKLGHNYKLFYYVHSQKYGKITTISLMLYHLISVPVVFLTPPLMIG